MKKKIFKICMIGLLLVSCNNKQTSDSVSDSSASSVDSSVSTSTLDNSSSKETKIELKTKKNSKIYLSDDYSYDLATTFFTFDEDIPYINLNYFINNFLVQYNNSIQHYSIAKNVITNIDTKVSLTFDVENNKIYTNDLDQFMNIFNLNKNSNDIIDISLNVHAEYSENDSSYTKGKEITIDLNDFHTKIVGYENETYVPFSYLDNIFCSHSSNRFVFNGDNFYNSAIDLMKGQDGDLNTYGNAYYSGSLASLKERSDSYINYFYYSFLFELLYNDGKNTYDVTSLDKKLEELGLKSELRSKDSKTASLAIAKTLYTVFSDGGHTRFTNLGFTTPYNEKNNDEASRLIYSMDSRNKKLVDTFDSLKAKRGDLASNLTIEGETAILRFDEFDESETVSTFNLFKESFETIQENKSVKNVVFDISLNGGGAAMSLCDALSFLTDEPIKIKTKNPNTGAINVESCKIDNNKDGNFDDNDSYQGKYKYYVLTSNFSYSCANAFAVYCKDYNLAKIIGQRSGGGDCSVAGGVSVDGSCWNMSSTSMLIRKDNSSYDDGAALDYELDDSYFYDGSKLNTYLSGLTK